LTLFLSVKFKCNILDYFLFVEMKKRSKLKTFTFNKHLLTIFWVLLSHIRGKRKVNQIQYVFFVYILNQITSLLISWSLIQIWILILIVFILSWSFECLFLFLLSDSPSSSLIMSFKINWVLMNLKLRRLSFLSNFFF